MATALVDSAEDVVVTDVWWFQFMTTWVSVDKPVFLVNSRDDDALRDLLPRLIDHDVQSFLFVTSPNKVVAAGELPDSTHWQIQSKQTVNSWLEMDFVVFVRR